MMVCLSRSDHAFLFTVVCLSTRDRICDRLWAYSTQNSIQFQFTWGEAHNICSYCYGFMTLRQIENLFFCTIKNDIKSARFPVQWKLVIKPEVTHFQYLFSFLNDISFIWMDQLADELPNPLSDSMRFFAKLNEDWENWHRIDAHQKLDTCSSVFLTSKPVIFMLQASSKLFEERGLGKHCKTTYLTYRNLNESETTLLHKQYITK